MNPSDVGAAGAGVQQGDVLAGKYRVDRVLGVGGMGVVVAAHHLHLDERVAIKFLLPQALTNPEAVARFDREARAAVKIKSEHVARIIDVGKLENGAPYMVMEYLEGRDLSAWIAERGPLPVEQAVEFVLQACEAIAEAHAMGIVHRDLKPANLFCIRRPDGALSIKVLDFGISKATGPGGAMGMTRTHSVMGSPLYMSPEQMGSSRDVDARTDIWALGVVLFELVTGRVPFEGEAITELVLKIVSAPTPSLRDLLPGGPPGLDPILHRCLEKDRQRRYADVSELANDLVVFAPPRARLSVERIAGVIGGAGGAGRAALHSAPPPAGGAAQAFPGGGTPLPGGGTPLPGGGTPLPGGMAGPWPAAHPGVHPGVTDPVWKQTGGAGKPRGALWAWVLGGASVLGLAAGGVALLAARRAAPPVAASSATTPPLAAPSAPGSTGGAPSVGPSTASADGTAAVPLPSLTPLPALAVAAESSAPKVHPASSTAPRGATRAPAPAKPAARTSCDPPYFIDGQGHRQYKPDCL